MKRKRQVRKHRQLPTSQPMPMLPTDMIEEILSRLPLNSLFQFRCVCKSWYHLVKDPHFIKMQLSQANEKPKILIACRYDQFALGFEGCDRTSIVDLHPPSQGSIYFQNSCNGLVCYVEQVREVVFVWNPFTGDYKKLPDVQSNGRGVFGLGYCPAMDEYKVVRLSSFSNANEVWVHGLGTISWRRVEYDLSKINAVSPGVYLNGALHWIAFRGTGHAKSYMILVFDLSDETFREMLLPDFRNTVPPYFRNEFMSYRIVLLSGRLSVHCFTPTTFRGDYCEIWVMEEYGNESSWSKQFPEIRSKFPERILGSKQFPKIRTKLGDRFLALKILGSTESGEILIAKSQRFVLFNPADQRFRLLCVSGRRFLIDANNYVESLVSPHG